jgi:hypothetical protein
VARDFLRGMHAVIVIAARVAQHRSGVSRYGWDWKFWTSSGEMATADARPSTDGYFVALRGRRRKAGT